MPDPERDEPKTVWDDFKPVSRRDRSEEGIASKVFVWAAFLIAGAIGGAVFGFFLPVMLLPRRRKLEFWSQSAEQMAEGSLPRVLVGAGVGVAVMAVWLWRRD